MSGCSAFTCWVRFNIPLTPFDFAQGRLGQAQGERDIESLNGCLGSTVNPFVLSLSKDGRVDGSQGGNQPHSPNEHT